MFHSHAKPLWQKQPQPATKTRVCVVDPSPADYRAWQAEAQAAGLELILCLTAEEALRLARTDAVDLWVVNTALPGLSGCELCTMLKTRSSRTPVYLVADEYSPAAEQAAWQARATLFGCKGEHSAWLSHWREQHAAERRHFAAA